MNRISISNKSTNTISEFYVFSPNSTYIRRIDYFPYTALVFTAGDSKTLVEISLYFDNKEVLRDTLKQLLKDIGE